MSNSMPAIVVTSTFEMYFGYITAVSGTGAVDMSDVTYVGRAYDTETKEHSTEVAFNKAMWGEPELNFSSGSFIPRASFPHIEAIFQCSQQAADTFGFFEGE